MFEDLDHLSDQSSGSIVISEVPEKSNKTYTSISDVDVELLNRKFDGKIDNKWRVSSFSSIAHSRYKDDHGDKDEHLNDDMPTGMANVEQQLRDDSDIDSVFLFPKGAAAGTCLHEIFETIDFTQPESDETASIIEDKLRSHGFEAEWNNTISNMIRQVLSVPLEGDGNAFSLSSIGQKNRLNELEFYYPVNDMTPIELGRLFSENYSQSFSEQFSGKINALNSKEISGYMKGFIDLVFQKNGRFYIVDWKSNFLGYKKSDYTYTELSKEIISRLYFLQYHIYAVALNKYLAVRIPEYTYENDFGGIYYLFLRGMSIDRKDGCGIFFDKPDRKLMTKLCAYFENT